MTLKHHLGAKSAVLAIYFLVLFVSLSVSQILLAEILSSKQSTNLNVWFVNIWILLILPELMTFLHEIWMSNIIAIDQYREWPEVKTLVNGIVVSVIDVVILSFLTTEVYPSIPPFLLACTSCIGVTSLIPRQNNVKAKCKSRRYSYWTLIMTMFQIFLLIGTTVFLILSETLSIELGCFFAVSLLILNMIRYSYFQMSIVGATDNKAQNAKLLYRFVRISSISAYIWGSSTYVDVNERSTFEYNATGDLAFAMVMTISFCVLLVQCQTCLPNFKLGTSFALVIVSMCSTMTVSVSLFIMGFSGYNLGIFRYIMKFPFFSVYDISLFICVGTSTLLFFLDAFLDLKIGNTPHKHCLVTLYDNIFPIQNLIKRVLNKIHAPQNGRQMKTRIFVCTTMYQESEYEMRRLLFSLKKLSISKAIKDRDIYMESHIVLDNGASERKIKEFGIQLLYLIEEIFKVSEEFGKMTYTPYGLSLSWIIPNEMPLYLHFKDVSLVKAKKRCSLIMYMRYILQYRTTTAQSCHTESRKRTIYTVDSYDNKQVEKGSDYTVNNGQVNSFIETAFLPDLEHGDAQFLNNKDTIKQEDVPCVNKKEVTLLVSNLQLESESTSHDSLISLKTLSEQHHTRDSKKNLQKEVTCSFVDIKIRDHMQERELDKPRRCDDDHVQDFILATDADMEFDDHNVLSLFDTIAKDDDVAGVCGLTIPTGTKKRPIIWFQMFEYIKDFMLTKSSQNIIGSVMCCPGCFSLYRLKAIKDVIDTFSEPTNSLLDVFTKDNGEDRWICTLMMKAGWMLRYSYYGRNTTFCPEKIEEFMKQRRRWILSDLVNSILVFRNIRSLMRNNRAFTVVYTLNLLYLMIFSILYPGFTIVMLALGFKLVTSCPLIPNVAFLSLVCLVYCIIQISTLHPHKKLTVSKVLIVLMGLLIVYVFSATCVELVQNTLKDATYTILELRMEYFLLLGTACLVLFLSLLHPTDCYVLPCTGVFFLFFSPMIFFIVPLYAICNIADQTWGTRDEQKASVPKPLRQQKIKKSKKRTRYNYQISFLEQLSSSAVDLQDIREDEAKFWQNLVSESIGIDVNTGLSAEEKSQGLQLIRNRILVAYLALNFVLIILLSGLLVYLETQNTGAMIYILMLGCIFGVPALIQLLGATIYRISYFMTRFGSLIA